LIWYVLICALIAIVAPWTTLPLYPEEGVFRFRWFAIHPIDAATLTGAAAIGLLGVIVFNRTPGVPVSAGLAMRGAFLVLVTLLVLTSSRAPMIALAVAIGLLFLLRMRPAFRAAAVLTAAAALTVLVVYVSEFRAWVEGIARQDTIVSRLMLRNQTVDDVFELNGRIGLWQELGPIVTDHVALGAGYQASRAALLEVADWASYAHNALLQTVLDLGMVGLVSMLALILLGFRAGFRRTNPPWVRATVPALMLFLVVNSLSSESFGAAPDIELMAIFLCAVCGTVPHNRPLAGRSPGLP
jgi:O-antigen ligase